MTTTIIDVAKQVRDTAHDRHVDTIECTVCGLNSDPVELDHVVSLVEHAVFDCRGGLTFVTRQREVAWDGVHLADRVGVVARTEAERRERALLHPCPACNAFPGHRCTQPDNFGRHEVQTLHSARTDLIP